MPQVSPALRLFLPASILMLGSPLTAETLPEALAAARDLNPRIESARAQSLGTNEGIVQARAGMLPKLTANADLGIQTSARNPSLSQTGSARQTGYDVTVVQPLFDGGRASNAVRRAKANSHAGSESVRAVIQQVLLSAATSYMDVRQDRNISRINEENVALLTKMARAIHLSAKVNEATAADVAQSDAAVANAQAQRELANANLGASEAAFEEAVTHPAGALAKAPPVDRLLPAGRDQALALAQQESPSVIQAVFKEEAALHSIAEARAHLLPIVNFQAGYQRRIDDPPALTTIGDSDGLVAKVVVSIPLYTGGAAESEVRQARYNHVASIHERAATVAQTRTGVAQAWARLSSARAALGSVSAQLTANRKALDGIRQEQRLGQRTVLDLLNAQQAVLAAQISREQIARNVAVASFTMLALAGRLDPETLESTPAAEKKTNSN